GLTGGGGVARVGGNEISAQKLLAEFDRTLRRARQQNPKLDARTAARQGALGEVYEQLIATTALETFGHDAGFAISERAIDGEIASVDAFRVGGKFDQATYRRLLAEQRLSERDLRDGLRGDLIRKQVLTPVLSGVQVPRTMAAPYAAVLLAARSGSIAIVPASAMPAPAAPTEAQLAAFYKGHAAAFTLPERRAFRYAMVDRDRLAQGVTVSDAEVKKNYDANADTYAGAETRKLLQVVVPDRAKADQIAGAVKAGKSFAAAAAAANGFAPADIDIGEQTKAKFAAATSPEVADAAFALKAGGTSAPVQSPFGWHVVSVTAVTPAKPRSLAAVRDEIVAKLKADRTEALLSDTVGRIEDALSGRTSLAEVAKRFNLVVAAVPAVTRAGAAPADPGFVLPPAAAPILPKAFDADPADGPTLQQLGKDSFAVVELGEITPPAVQPLAKVHDAVIAAYIADARLKAAKTVADGIVAEVAKGRPFASVVAAHNLPPAHPLSGRRVDLNTAQVPPPVKLFVTLQAGQTRALAAGPQGLWLVHVDSVTPGDPATAPALVDSARAEFARAAPDEIGAAFAAAVERAVGVKRDNAALAAATARVTGAAK
ncbi:MAG: peptidyl-prolyl cis-trans isomerase, partial [Sphingomonadaceae bacterium]|nr:peptidyl-prolyl cis-trans isomerase [Sphingomonadaceae bacterium]